MRTPPRWRRPRRPRGATAAPASRFRGRRRHGSPPPPAGLRTVGGIDALIALQGVEDPAERRRRAVKRGRRRARRARRAQDRAARRGTFRPATLTKLKSAAADLKDGSGDAELDGVLAEIELRVEVEIAKMAAALARNPTGGKGG